MATHQPRGSTSSSFRRRLVAWTWLGVFVGVGVTASMLPVPNVQDLPDLVAHLARDHDVPTTLSDTLLFDDTPTFQSPDSCVAPGTKHQDVAYRTCSVHDDLCITITSYEDWSHLLHRINPCSQANAPGTHVGLDAPSGVDNCTASVCWPRFHTSSDFVVRNCPFGGQGLVCSFVLSSSFPNYGRFYDFRFTPDVEVTCSLQSMSQDMFLHDAAETLTPGSAAPLHAEADVSDTGVPNIGIVEDDDDFDFDELDELGKNVAGSIASWMSAFSKLGMLAGFDFGSLSFFHSHSRESLFDGLDDVDDLYLGRPNEIPKQTISTGSILTKGGVWSFTKRELRHRTRFYPSPPDATPDPDVQEPDTHVASGFYGLASAGKKRDGDAMTTADVQDEPVMKELYAQWELLARDLIRQERIPGLQSGHTAVDERNFSLA